METVVSDEALIVGTLLGQEPHASSWRAQLGGVVPERGEELVADVNSFPVAVNEALARRFGAGVRSFAAIAQDKRWGDYISSTSPSSSSSSSSSSKVDRNALIDFLGTREAGLNAILGQLARCEVGGALADKPLNRKTMALLFRQAGMGNETLHAVMHAALEQRCLQASGEASGRSVSEVSVTTFHAFCKAQSGGGALALALAPGRWVLPAGAVDTGDTRGGQRHPLVVAAELAAGQPSVGVLALCAAWQRENGLSAAATDALCYLADSRVTTAPTTADVVSIDALKRLATVQGYAFRVKSVGGNIQSDDFDPLATTDSIYQQATAKLLNKLKEARTPRKGLPDTLPDLVITLDKERRLALVNSTAVCLCECVPQHATLWAWSEEVDISMDAALTNSAITHMHVAEAEAAAKARAKAAAPKAAAAATPKVVTSMDVNKMLKPTKTIKIDSKPTFTSPDHDAHRWSVLVCAKYLTDVLEMPQYEEAFLRAEVSGAKLLSFDDVQLTALQLSHPLHAKKILMHSKALRHRVLEKAAVHRPLDFSRWDQYHLAAWLHFKEECPAPAVCALRNRLTGWDAMDRGPDEIARMCGGVGTAESECAVKAILSKVAVAKEISVAAERTDAFDSLEDETAAQTAGGGMDTGVKKETLMAQKIREKKEKKEEEVRQQEEEQDQQEKKKKKKKGEQEQAPSPPSSAAARTIIFEEEQEPESSSSRVAADTGVTSKEEGKKKKLVRQATPAASHGDKVTFDMERNEHDQDQHDDTDHTHGPQNYPKRRLQRQLTRFERPFPSVTFEEGTNASVVAPKLLRKPTPTAAGGGVGACGYSEELEEEAGHDDNDEVSDLGAAPLVPPPPLSVPEDMDSSSDEFLRARQQFLERISSFERTVARQSGLITQLQERGRQEEEHRHMLERQQRDLSEQTATTVRILRDDRHRATAALDLVTDHYVADVAALGAEVETARAAAASAGVSLVIAPTPAPVQSSHALLSQSAPPQLQQPVGGLRIDVTGLAETAMPMNPVAALQISVSGHGESPPPRTPRSHVIAALAPITAAGLGPTVGGQPLLRDPHSSSVEFTVPGPSDTLGTPAQSIEPVPVSRMALSQRATTHNTLSNENPVAEARSYLAVEGELEVDFRATVDAEAESESDTWHDLIREYRYEETTEIEADDSAVVLRRIAVLWTRLGVKMLEDSSGANEDVEPMMVSALWGLRKCAWNLLHPPETHKDRRGRSKTNQPVETTADRHEVGVVMVFMLGLVKKMLDRFTGKENRMNMLFLFNQVREGALPVTELGREDLRRLLHMVLGCDVTDWAKFDAVTQRLDPEKKGFVDAKKCIEAFRRLNLFAEALPERQWQGAPLVLMTLVTDKLVTSGKELHKFMQDLVVKMAPQVPSCKAFLKTSEDEELGGGDDDDDDDEGDIAASREMQLVADIVHELSRDFFECPRASVRMRKTSSNSPMITGAAVTAVSSSSSSGRSSTCGGKGLMVGWSKEDLPEFCGHLARMLQVYDGRGQQLMTAVTTLFATFVNFRRASVRHALGSASSAGATKTKRDALTRLLATLETGAVSLLGPEKADRALSSSLTLEDHESLMCEMLGLVLPSESLSATQTSVEAQLMQSRAKHGATLSGFTAGGTGTAYLKMLGAVRRALPATAAAPTAGASESAGDAAPEVTGVIAQVNATMYRQRCDQMADFLDYLNARAEKRKGTIEQLLFLWDAAAHATSTQPRHLDTPSMKRADVVAEVREAQKTVLCEMQRRPSTHLEQLAARFTAFKVAYKGGTLPDPDGSLLTAMQEASALERGIRQSNTDCMRLAQRILRKLDT